MNTWLFLMSWSPVVLLTLLAVVFRRSALELSVYGFLFSLILGMSLFQTSPTVVVLSALDGILTTLPLLFVILAGIFLSTLLATTGSLKRIVEWFGQGAGDGFSRNLLITFGIGNFMEGSGVIAEPVVAPMLHAAGVSPSGSAALSIIGYAGMMTLEMAGIIVTVLALITDLPLRDLGVASAWLSIPAMVLMSLCVPFFLKSTSWNPKKIMVLICCGLLLGGCGLLSALYVGIPVSGTLAGLVMILTLLFFGPGGLQMKPGILFDLAPFFFLLLCLLAVNTIPWLHWLTFKKLAFQVNLIPTHTITFRPFFSAYLYLFLSFLLAARLQKVPRELFRLVIRTGFKKGWVAMVAMGLFSAMGQIISFTGYAPGFVELDAAYNIPLIISQGLGQSTGALFPIFVPFLGWVGTFLTGYGVASLMLFGNLQVQAASLLGVSPVWLASSLAVGGSLGSISSPFKIALATTMCGAVGQEGDILRKTIPMGVIASLLVGLVTWWIL